VCSQQQHVPASGIDPGANGVGTVRRLFVASNCNGRKTSPHAALVFEFTSGSAVEAGLPTVKAAYPRGETIERAPLVT